MPITTPTQMRIRPDVKDPAVARAVSDGVTLSVVVSRFLREYGAGRLPLPPPEPPDKQD